MHPKVAAIVLNYNHPEDTKSCIKNLKLADKYSQLEVFVVDNSPPNPNLGFAGGINKGLRQALHQGFDYFLIINPDVTVGKDIYKLLDHFSDPRVGIVAPAIRHKQNGRVMYGSDGFVEWKYAKAEHYNQAKPLKNQVKNSEFVTFACAIISSDLIKEIGFIDERYFMYCEDVDYCLQARRAGFKILLDTSILVDHNTSSSFSKPTQKLPISFKSQLKFIAKWLPAQKQPVAYTYHILMYCYLYLLWTYHYYKKNGKVKK